MELRLTTTPFDPAYEPAAHTRLTTNFANLAKDPVGRATRIAATLQQMQRRFHAALGEPADADRYQLELEILTIAIRFADSAASWFPMTETLRCRIHDRLLDRWLLGPTGCNYSSYVRDYDFNVVLPRIRAGHAVPRELETFGDLHGLLFRVQFRRYHPGGVLDDPVVIAISVSHGREYRRSGLMHPVLGREYRPVDAESTTSRYFAKMGLQVAYFLPPWSRAPLAFYHQPGDLLARPPEELAVLVAIMDTFESIYRPEIYLTRVPAGEVFVADLGNRDHDPPAAVYDRVERDTTLGRVQAEWCRNEFLVPNAAAIERLIVECGHLLRA